MQQKTTSSVAVSSRLSSSSRWQVLTSGHHAWWVLEPVALETRTACHRLLEWAGRCLGISTTRCTSEWTSHSSSPLSPTPNTTCRLTRLWWKISRQWWKLGAQCKWPIIKAVNKVQCSRSNKELFLTKEFRLLARNEWKTTCSFAFLKSNAVSSHQLTSKRWLPLYATLPRNNNSVFNRRQELTKVNSPSAQWIIQSFSSRKRGAWDNRQVKKTARAPSWVPSLMSRAVLSSKTLITVWLSKG